MTPQSTNEFAKTPWQATTNVAFYKPTAMPRDDRTVIMWWRDRNPDSEYPGAILFCEAVAIDNRWGYIINDEEWAPFNRQTVELVCWCYIPVPPWLRKEWEAQEA